MPYGDRTGPEGTGPRSGRGLGFCTGFNSPGFTKGTPRGKGNARGRGRGRRFRTKADVNPREIPRSRNNVSNQYSANNNLNQFRNNLTREEEIEGLKRYAEDLKNELKQVEKRIENLVKSD